MYVFLEWIDNNYLIHHQLLIDTFSILEFVCRPLQKMYYDKTFRN